MSRHQSVRQDITRTPKSGLSVTFAQHVQDERVKSVPVLLCSVLYFNLAMHRLLVRMSCPLALSYICTVDVALTHMFLKSP